jgi:hypothetical protein
MRGSLFLLSILFFLLVPSFASGWVIRDQTDLADANAASWGKAVSMEYSPESIFLLKPVLVVGAQPGNLWVRSPVFQIEAGKPYSLSFSYSATAPFSMQMIQFSPEENGESDQYITIANSAVSFGHDNPPYQISDSRMGPGWKDVKIDGLTFTGSGRGAIFIYGNNFKLANLNGPVSFGSPRFNPVVPAFVVGAALLLLAVFLIGRNVRRNKPTQADDANERRALLDGISKDVFEK